MLEQDIQTAAEPLDWRPWCVRKREEEGEREGGKRGRGMEQLALRPTAAVAPSSCAAAFIDSRSESQSERGKREDFDWRKRVRVNSS